MIFGWIYPSAVVFGRKGKKTSRGDIFVNTPRKAMAKKFCAGKFKTSIYN